MSNGYEEISITWPRARQDHRCIWCGEAIPRGATYRHEVSKYEGELQNHKWHAECVEASSYHFDHGEQEFRPYENERPAPPPDPSSEVR